MARFEGLELDDATGLPKLDEGQWWEVRSEKKITKWVADIPLYDYGYQVQIRSIVHKTDEYKKRHWWSKKKEFIPLKKPYDYEAVLKSEWITKRDTDPMFGDSNTITETFDKTALLRAAARAKKDYEKQMVTYTLMGKYPPNTLTEKVENA